MGDVKVIPPPHGFSTWQEYIAAGKKLYAERLWNSEHEYERGKAEGAAEERAKLHERIVELESELASRRDECLAARARQDATNELLDAISIPAGRCFDRAWAQTCLLHGRTGFLPTLVIPNTGNGSDDRSIGDYVGYVRGYGEGVRSGKAEGAAEERARVIRILESLSTREDEASLGPECAAWLVDEAIEVILAGESTQSGNGPVDVPKELTLTERQRAALEKLLVRIGSFTSARFHQHLRYEVGDDDTNAILQFLAAHGVRP